MTVQPETRIEWFGTLRVDQPIKPQPKPRKAP